jgi:CRP/FNR family transcriptional regulator, cyclic AMP receptor protein
MITVQDLRRVVVLGNFSDPMLQSFLPLVRLLHFSEGEVVFREKEPAEHFFFLKTGKVLIEQRLSEKITVSIDSIKPGYSFGWSAVLGGDIEPYSRYTSDAICVESSAVLAVNGDELRDLLDNDHTMGYLFTRRLNRVIKQRLVHRTEQFLRIIRQHPDIYELI